MLMKKLLLIIVFTGCFLCTACGSSTGKSADTADGIGKTADEKTPYTEGKGSSCHLKLEQEGEQTIFFKMQEGDVFVIDLSDVQGIVDINLYGGDEESLYASENRSAGAAEENTIKIPVEKGGTYTMELAVSRTGGTISLAIE